MRGTGPVEVNGFLIYAQVTDPGAGRSGSGCRRTSGTGWRRASVTGSGLGGPAGSRPRCW